MRIIIVDDDYYTCQTLSQFLVTKGFSTHLHNNISDAVRTLLAEECDLMLLDYHLPGINGTDALPIIREVSPQLPVVLMMDETTREDRQKALQAGAFRLLQKPIDHRELLGAIGSTHEPLRSE